MSVVSLPTHPRAGTTKPKPRGRATDSDVVPLRAWTPAERKAALERLCEIVDADPRGGALAKALRQSIAKY